MVSILIPVLADIVQQLIERDADRIKLLAFGISPRRYVDLHPRTDFDPHSRRCAVGDPTHFVFWPHNRSQTLAAARVGRPLIVLYPVLFSGAQDYLRRSLSELTVVAGTPIGSLSEGMAQTLTHEYSHCVLGTRDLCYNWDTCAHQAGISASGVDFLDNAETMSGIVFFLFCLVQFPQWDFSSGEAVQRLIPAWVSDYWAGSTGKHNMISRSRDLEPRILRLRSREVTWRR